MKVLVAIASFGTKNLKYLQVLLSEYRRMPFAVDIVVLSNEPKDLGPGIEVRVGLPASNPYSLPFAHKRLFAERVEDYDLFIYCEDDTLLTEKNISAFLEAERVLPGDVIAGFLRYETGPDGRRHVSSAHGRFHWRPESARQVAGQTFAEFTNAHSACFLLTRPQLQRVIASGGFLVEPYAGEYGMLETAATDPYTRCGLTKVINVSRIEEFLLPHLPNKYVGVLGTEYGAFLAQIEALKQIAAGRRPAVNALPKLQPPLTYPWSKSYYEPCSPEVLELVPQEASSILSLAIGTGETECELARRGYDVTAVPLDSVIGAAAESKGVKMVHTELTQSREQLGPRRFDCVIMRNLLYLHENPPALILAFSPLLAEGGSLLILEPNFGNVQTYAGRLLGKERSRGLGSFQQSRVTPVTGARLRRWLKPAGLKINRLLHTAEAPVSRRDQVLRRLPLPITSDAMAVLAQRDC